MLADAKANETSRLALTFPWYGWLGAAMALLGWILNWTLLGLRTYWAFFPMWLGYCLAVDALVRKRTGTSLLARSARQYAGLFLISAPVWWLFEAINLRTQNWVYLGAENFTSLQYAFWTTLSFSTVVPAVFGSAELVASFGFLRRLRPGPRLGTNLRTTLPFFAAGWLMLAATLAWPAVFFPFAWMCLYFIIEPVNIWIGNRSLADWTRSGDWSPVLALWLGVLLTAGFWEMWNFLSYPKWIYHVPWGDWLHVFEMPLLGYGGYLPFSLELFALYHLIERLFRRGGSDYVRVAPAPADSS